MHTSYRTCCATTDKTSRSIRLNSSKHAHAPEAARPLKNLPCGVTHQTMSGHRSFAEWHRACAVCNAGPYDKLRGAWESGRVAQNLH